MDLSIYPPTRKAEPEQLYDRYACYLHKRDNFQYLVSCKANWCWIIQISQKMRGLLAETMLIQHNSTNQSILPRDTEIPAINLA